MSGRGAPVQAEQATPWSHALIVRALRAADPDGETILEPPLQGHRLPRASGAYVVWESDAQGRLYSDVLGLWLVVRDGELRAQRRDGSWLPTLEEAEDEIARLRAELERLRRS